jgi:hypothetical protein
LETVLVGLSLVQILGPSPVGLIKLDLVID